MTVGLVLGKFLPPHRGHVHLCRFAEDLVDRLVIVVGSLPDEPIPGAVRYRWMRELFPACEVVHLDRVMPQYPHEHPDFWALWREALLEISPQRPDVVVASEDYGVRLAAELGARFVPCDLGRDAVSVSGTAIREDPMTWWDQLPAPVRPWFVRRVAVVGGESVGKTTLARGLAEHFGTVHVPEYARTWLEVKGSDPTADDFGPILAGQRASERSLARQAYRCLITDTDRLSTTVWADVFGVPLPDDLRRDALSDPYDLTLLLAPDVPWVADPVRYLPDGGRDFHERLHTRLQQAGRPNIVEVRGDWDARWQTAQAAMTRLCTR